MAEPTREQIIDIIDQLAREWDGCEYDAPGENIDIGDAIRTAGYRRVHKLFDAPGVAGTFICRKPAIRPACEKQCETCAADGVMGNEGGQRG